MTPRSSVGVWATADNGRGNFKSQYEKFSIVRIESKSSVELQTLINRSLNEEKRNKRDLFLIFKRIVMEIGPPQKAESRVTKNTKHLQTRTTQTAMRPNRMGTKMKNLQMRCMLTPKNLSLGIFISHKTKSQSMKNNWC